MGILYSAFNSSVDVSKDASNSSVTVSKDASDSSVTVSKDASDSGVTASDSSVTASKYLTEVVSSTGYRAFSSGKTIRLFPSVVEITTEVLSKAMEKYNCSYWKDAIKEKLLAQQKKNPRLLNDIKNIYGMDIDSFAATLGDEEAFKEQFLLPYYKPNKVLKELDILIEDLLEIKNEGDEITEGQFRKSIERLNERRKNLSESKLELILTECRASENNILIRTLINKIYEFGVLHSAISLDGTIIEWGRDPCGQDLVCPTLDIKKFLFAFEIKTKEDHNFFVYIWNKIKDAGAFILNLFSGGAYGRWSLGRANSDKIDKIAKICVKYNRTKFYNPMTNNCQHFVREILDAIGADFTFDGEFGKIIKKLEKEGKVDFIFKEKIFKKRKELDEYVKSIHFSTLPPNEKKLLICYKNTFDIYLRNDPKNENYQSTEESEKYWSEIISQEKEELLKEK